MVEVADLNLLTYVIQFEGGRYYATKPTAIGDIDWSHPYSTEDLAKANIFNDPEEAKKACKSFGRGKVLPVSKRTFFMASLKGER